MTCTDKAAEIKVGDVFEIRVTVLNEVSETGSRWCEVLHGYKYWLSPEVIRSGRRVERPLAVGDRIRMKDRSCNAGIVKAVDGDDLWIDWPSGNHNAPSFKRTQHRDELEIERAPAAVKDQPQQGSDPQRGNPHNDH